MRIYNFPKMDASIYEEFNSRNTGLDEILEVGKTNDGRFSVRSLLQFDLSTFTNIPPNAKFDLVMYVANAEKLNPSQTIELGQVSQSWMEGSGYFYQDQYQVIDGVTWIYRSSGSVWPIDDQGGSIYPATVTGSLNLENAQLTADVSDLVRTWISGSENNGILIRFPVNDENNLNNQGNIKFFSNQTHTIYKPALIAKWDDQVYLTGSFMWPTSSLLAIPSTKLSYRQGETARVAISVREQYPLKTFSNVGSKYTSVKYLPSSSYYSIVDELSGTVLIPFSEESKISVDGNQNYFVFKIQNMYPLRYYRVLLKVVHDGLEEIFDQNVTFMVK